ISYTGKGFPAQYSAKWLGKKKRQVAPAPPQLRGGGRFGGLVLGLARVGALGGNVAVDEFDHPYGRIITLAEAGLYDAGVSPVAGLVPGARPVETTSGPPPVR